MPDVLLFESPRESLNVDKQYINIGLPKDIYFSNIERRAISVNNCEERFNHNKFDKRLRFTTDIFMPYRSGLLRVRDLHQNPFRSSKLQIKPTDIIIIMCYIYIFKNSKNGILNY